DRRHRARESGPGQAVGRQGVGPVEIEGVTLIVDGDRGGAGTWPVDGDGPLDAVDGAGIEGGAATDVDNVTAGGLGIDDQGAAGAMHLEGVTTEKATAAAAVERCEAGARRGVDHEVIAYVVGSVDEDPVIEPTVGD